MTKKKTIQIFVLLFSLSLFSQRVEKQHYSNGQLHYIGKMNNNNRAYGTWKRYHRNGQLMEIGDYSGYGEYAYNKKGVWKTYHDNGKLESRGKYKNNEKTGKWEVYHDNGELSSVGYYNSQGAEGTHKSYYSNGQKEYIKNHKKGEWHGEFIHYFKSGKIETIGRYKNDEREGEWKTYFEEGKVKEQGSYVSGNKQGEWKEVIDDKEFILYDFIKENNVMNLEDKLYRVALYQDDEINGGKANFYSLNGTYIGYINIFYDNDEPKGEFKLYHPNKNILSEGVLSIEDEGFINVKIYHQSGNLLKKIPLVRI